MKDKCVWIGILCLAGCWLTCFTFHFGIFVWCGFLWCSLVFASELCADLCELVEMPFLVFSTPGRCCALVCVVGWRVVLVFCVVRCVLSSCLFSSLLVFVCVRCG